jgi:acyl-CoA synthetase (NDP forming)
MLASADRRVCQRPELLLKDDGVDGLMIVLPPPPMSTASAVVGAMLPILRGADKPVVVALMGEDLIVHAARLLRQAKVPDYRFPERAATALRALWGRARQLQDLPQKVETLRGSSRRWPPDLSNAAPARKVLSISDRGPGHAAMRCGFRKSWRRRSRKPKAPPLRSAILWR